MSLEIPTSQFLQMCPMYPNQSYTTIVSAWLTTEKRSNHEWSLKKESLGSPARKTVNHLISIDKTGGPKNFRHFTVDASLEWALLTIRGQLLQAIISLVLTLAKNIIYEWILPKHQQTPHYITLSLLIVLLLTSWVTDNPTIHSSMVPSRYTLIINTLSRSIHTTI